MPQLRVIGIPREASKAGKPEQDAKILSKIGEKLKSRGHLFSTEPYTGLARMHQEKPQIIVSMARTSEVLLALSKLQAQGIKVVNSPQAVYACGDLIQLYHKMEEAAIPFPSTRPQSLEELSYQGQPLILKKPYEYGLRDSTMHVDSQPKMERAKILIEEEGNRVALVRPLVEGEPYKAYGVGDKIWLPGLPQDEVSLAEEATKSFLELGKKVAGLAFFGVDFLLRENRSFMVTALNDFPSYGPVIEEAAGRIVDYIESI